MGEKSLHARRKSGDLQSKHLTGMPPHRKKRIRILCILGIGACLCFILAKYALTNLIVSEEIHPTVSQMLETLDIHECTLTQLSDYDDIRVSIATPSITEDEYAKYIQSQHEEEDAAPSEDKLRKQLLEEKKIERLMLARAKVLNTLLSRCEFSLKEECVAVYAKTVVHNYETEAALYGLSLIQYSQEILGCTKEQFYQKCYNEGAEAIKTFLVIGAVAEKEFPDLARKPDTNNIYIQYQEIENAVYAYFIETDTDF